MSGTKDYVAGWRQRAQEMFVPLVHPPGHAQADFGEAIGIIGGVERKIHFFAFDLPHSDACFVMAYPAKRAETFRDGHVQAFMFFGGVPNHRGEYHFGAESLRGPASGFDLKCPLPARFVQAIGSASLLNWTFWSSFLPLPRQRRGCL
jgi:hypothetical protein